MPCGKESECLSSRKEQRARLRGGSAAGAQRLPQGCDPRASAVYTTPASRWDWQSGCRSCFSPAAPAHLHPEPAQCGPQARPRLGPGRWGPRGPAQLRTRTERVSLDCKQLPCGECWGRTSISSCTWGEQRDEQAASSPGAGEDGRWPAGRDRTGDTGLHLHGHSRGSRRTRTCTAPAGLRREDVLAT